MHFDSVRENTNHGPKVAKRILCLSVVIKCVKKTCGLILCKVCLGLVYKCDASTNADASTNVSEVHK